MKVVIFALALLGTVGVHASECTQSVEDVASELQARRAGVILACEIRQVLAAEERHVEITGGSCEQGSGVKLVAVSDQKGASLRGANLLQSKISVVNSGVGQPADTYTVVGKLDVNGDCQITSVKLAPLSEGLSSSEQYPYKHYPSQKN